MVSEHYFILPATTNLNHTNLVSSGIKELRKMHQKLLVLEVAKRKNKGQYTIAIGTFRPKLVCVHQMAIRLFYTSVAKMNFLWVTFISIIPISH